MTPETPSLDLKLRSLKLPSFVAQRATVARLSLIHI